MPILRIQKEYCIIIIVACENNGVCTAVFCFKLSKKIHKTDICCRTQKYDFKMVKRETNEKK